MSSRPAPWRLADRAAKVAAAGGELRQFAPENLFHVRLLPRGRRVIPRRLRLRPQVPRNAMAGEDQSLRRVSLAPSVGGALAALRIDRSLDPHLPPPGPAGIWTNVEPVEGWLPSWDLVPDAEASGEVWSLRSVRVKRIAVLPSSELMRLGSVAQAEIEDLRDSWDPDDERWDLLDSDEVAAEEVRAVRTVLEWEVLEWELYRTSWTR